MVACLVVVGVGVLLAGEELLDALLDLVEEVLHADGWSWWGYLGFFKLLSGLGYGRLVGW